MSTVMPSEMVTRPRQEILLQTAEGVAVSGENTALIRCLFDGGSQRSFIKESLSRALKFPVTGNETLNIYTFGSTVPVKASMRKVKVTLRNVQDASKMVVIEALETPDLCHTVLNVPGQDIRALMKERKLQMADAGLIDSGDNREIAVLIGADNYWKTSTGKNVRLKGDLVAIDTILGWCVQGPTENANDTCLSVEVLKAVVEQDLVSQQLRSFWELESLGIVEGNDSSLSEADQKVLDNFESSIRYEDGRYKIGLPWKDNADRLADNYATAERRLSNLVKNFKSDSTFYESYNSVIREQLAEGIVERVQNDSLETLGRKIYYLPHRAVVRMNHESTKLRVVFDGSSHGKGMLSLNECLHPGPNLNPNLLSVLLKFRKHKIAVVADIEKAFLQISLTEEDRDAVRFLWFEESPLSDPMQDVKHFRMTRVVFGATSSPFILAATLKFHFRKYESKYPEITELLNKDLYVDDLISGGDNVQQALRVSCQAKEILSEAGMCLKKWKTNSEDLRLQWEKNQIETNFKTCEMNLAIKSRAPLKVLGLCWNNASDNFYFDFKSLLKFLENDPKSKRSVLQTVSRIFDPLGLLSPFIIRVKCLFQRIWEKGLQWDDALPNDLRKLWEDWCAEIPFLEKMSIPRCCFPYTKENVTKTEFHGFCDASPQAYGGVIYVRQVVNEGEVLINLLISKTRVAPLKKLTLPRLELMGALLLARLMRQVLEFMEVDQVEYFLWSDSTIVLHWIKGTAKQWKPFVENRIIEIQNISNPEFWLHCSGRDNPADLLTRGEHATNLTENKFWMNGPEWLSNKKETWSSFLKDVNTDEAVDSTEWERGLRALQFATVSKSENKCELLLDIKGFSSLTRLLRITAWILRFIRNVKHLNKTQTTLDNEDLNEARVYWIKAVQKAEFEREWVNLKEGKALPENSVLAHLNPFLDENDLLRVMNRIQDSSMSFSKKRPCILPANHKLTELIIQDSHARVMHQGIGDTLAQVRENFWVIRGRQVVKGIINKCLICRRLSVKPATQIMAPLPSDRILQSSPFEVTGVDFAGPLYLKYKTEQVKSYIVLFTCSVTRAVHLELASDLTTGTFHLALRRFVSRRGLCKVIYSDNAQTFKRANKDLKEIWKNLKEKDLVDMFSSRGIRWKFIVEKAPWHGGFYERLVRSIKTCLRKILGKASLRYEEMNTVLAEVEAVINSRPITYVYNDIRESEPLCPSHFLIGKRITALPDQKEMKNDALNSNREDLSCRIKYRETLINRFWKRWRCEYLQELRTAQYSGNPTTANIKVDDVILIKEDKIPRHMWKTGRIKEIYPGRDGKVRTVLIGLPSGGDIRRAIQHVYPLEIH